MRWLFKPVVVGLIYAAFLGWGLHLFVLPGLPTKPAVAMPPNTVATTVVQAPDPIPTTASVRKPQDTWSWVSLQLNWFGYSFWLPLQLVLLMLIHTRVIMKDYGVERLFWEERWHVQFFSLFGTGLVVATAFYVWYLFDKPDLFDESPDEWWKSWNFFAGSENEVRKCGRFIATNMLVFGGLLLLFKVVNALRQSTPTRVGPTTAYPPAGTDAPAQTNQQTGVGSRLGSTRVGQRWRAFRGWRDRSRKWRFVRSRFGFLPGIAGYLFTFAFGWFVIWLHGAVREQPFVRDILQYAIQLDELQAKWDAVVKSGRAVERYFPSRTFDKGLHELGGFLVGLTLLSVVILLVLSLIFRSDRRWAMNPALLVCLMIVLSDAALGWFAFNTQNQIVFFLWIFVAVVLVNWGRLWCRQRYRFADLADSYAVPWPIADRYPPAEDAVQARDDEALKAHVAANPDKKLVLIATSGGGIRAAVWTAHLLERFGRTSKQMGAELGEGWWKQVRIVTGASGGMVGAALWAGGLAGVDGRQVPVSDPKEPEGWGAFARRLFGGGPPVPAGYPLTQIAGTAALRPVVQTMIQWDMLRGILAPFVMTSWTDRGHELESQWKLAADEYYCPRCQPNPFKRTFAEFRELERLGTFPSLVFAPVAVEDTRRWLISNLDLKWFARPELSPTTRASEAKRESDSQLSRSSYELFKAFPLAHTTLTLGTAARMNATFPVISPLAPLPTDPPRRLMDAGLYDNYGVEFLSHWMLKYQKDLKDSAGVVLIEIRAFPRTKQGLNTGSDDGDMRSVLSESAAMLTGPLGALFRGRGNIIYHRNNILLQAVEQSLGSKFDRVVFELEEEAAMSWYLSSMEIQDIADYADTADIQQGFQKLRGLLK